MFSAVSRAFAEAFRNLRNNFFQTFLSVLGVIIGVGALVAMLAMIDGLEEIAQERIADTSSLENLVIVPNAGTRVDGIYTQRDTIAEFTPAVLEELLDSLPQKATGELIYQNTVVGYNAVSVRMGLRYTTMTMPTLNPPPDSIMLAGAMFTAAEAKAGARVTLVNAPLAKRLLPAGDTVVANALGRQLYLFGDSLSVVGIYEGEDPNNLKLDFPLVTLTSLTDAPDIYPSMNLALDKVNEVLP
ncbi:MAG: ABC transporter permease, partial [Bacteroidota bacterium]